MKFIKKFYYKDQLWLALFMLLSTIYFYFLAINFKKDYSNKENKYDIAIVVEKKCRPIKGQSNLMLNYTDSIFTTRVTDEECEKIEVGEKVNTVYNKDINRLFIKNAYNFDNKGKWLFFSIFLMSIIPFKLLIKIK